MEQLPCTSFIINLQRQQRNPLSLDEGLQSSQLETNENGTSMCIFGIYMIVLMIMLHSVSSCCSETRPQPKKASNQDGSNSTIASNNTACTRHTSHSLIREASEHAVQFPNTRATRLLRFFAVYIYRRNYETLEYDSAVSCIYSSKLTKQTYISFRETNRRIPSLASDLSPSKESMVEGHAEIESSYFHYKTWPWRGRGFLDDSLMSFLLLPLRRCLLCMSLLFLACRFVKIWICLRQT